jgi:hypothetical protein
MSVTFPEAINTVATQWPDYNVADYGFDGGGEWFVLLLPETAGGRIAAVDKTSGAVRWTNENDNNYTEEHPVSVIDGKGRLL